MTATDAITYTIGDNVVHFHQRGEQDGWMFIDEMASRANLGWLLRRWPDLHAVACVARDECIDRGLIAG